jgi:hypothetical protein
LTLSGYDERFNQIELFISLFSLERFTGLKVLKLYAMQENELKDILERVNTHSIFLFSLSVISNGNHSETMTATLLSSIFTRSNLRKLELNIYSNRIEKK